MRAVKLTFNPPEEPNGNITEYIVYIYEKDQLVRNISLNIIQKENNTMDAVIEGLKGGRTYSLQVKNTPLWILFFSLQTWDSVCKFSM